MAASIPPVMKAFATHNRSILGTAWRLASKFNIGHEASVQEVPVPTLDPSEVLVKVSCVAQNVSALLSQWTILHTHLTDTQQPTDHKHIDMLGQPGSILGCDYAGTVASIGAQAKGNWHVGDRIAGVVHGGIYPDRGSYAEYLKIDGDLAWKIPENVSDAEAATYGVSATTAMQALHLVLGLPWPGDEAPPASAGDKAILIYSGATSASLFAIQLAKLAGYTVVTTCSPRSNDLVKKYGADAVYDYRDSKSLAAIISAYPNLSLALDGFSEGASTKFCCEAVAPNNGTVVSLDPMAKSSVKGVTLRPIIMYTLFGRAFGLLQPVGPKFPVKPEDRAGLARFYAMLPGLVKNGSLKAPPIQEQGNGFDKLAPGLDLLREGKVQGRKLVVHLP
jgi:NADPH:quinone reductase-like Zn-dependent oxidoreductase